MKKRRLPSVARFAPIHSQPIDPAELAAGYLFPELFADQPRLQLESQLADDAPFAPTAAIQRALPGMPAVDWDHVRQKDAARKRQRRRRK